MNDSHDVVASVRPVVEVDDSIFQAALFQLPELQTPQWQASHALRVVPFHYRNWSHSIRAMTAIQESVDPCRICLQLLEQRKQSTKRLGIRGPNRSKVSGSIVVDSEQDYTKDDMTVPVDGIPQIRGGAVCDRFCMNWSSFPEMAGSIRACRGSTAG